MKLALIGSGGREHALALRLLESPQVSCLYILPGNPGMLTDTRVQLVPDIAAEALEAIVTFCQKEAVDLVVVGPEKPLVMGLADRLASCHIPCFGPKKAAAALEGSKIFAKQLMREAKIPTADFELCYTLEDAEKALAKRGPENYPVVLKADGLAQGKGVVIAPDKACAQQAAEAMLVSKQFGEAGAAIVLEDYLGEPEQELSVMVLSDGENYLSFPVAMDHKRIGEGDKGLNTGGMGAIAPNPLYTAELEAEVARHIIEPTLRAMKRRQSPFVGCLYVGLMLTQEGPKVIEYNCRFGDPECQTLLPLLEGDFCSLLWSCATASLQPKAWSFRQAATCTVVLAAEGYPAAYPKGMPLHLERAQATWPKLCQEGETLALIHAGTALSPDFSGMCISQGGRVLNVVARAEHLTRAIDLAYQALPDVCFDRCYFRRDIGQAALKSLAKEAEK